MAAALAALPRPNRPRHLTGLGPNDVDLRATALLPGRFELAGARVEETWSSGAAAQRDGVVLAASVLGVADDLVFGTANPRTRGILRASIPRHLGAFVAVPRGRAGIMGWAARRGIVHEHVPADSALRDALFVRGDDDAARALLTSDVQGPLVALAPIMWRLSVGGGVVELTWRAPYFTAGVVLPREAVDLCVAVARASVTAR
ncbi:MAG: hypothetical protein QOI41_7048 [Myxococcales bacterium]|nr:hypothetical protein [Myxococcales bacterium]